MATVYLAQDLKHDREVAIKGLKSELAAVIGAVRALLASKVTEQLPEAWRGPYSERRALEWILDRELEGIPPLVVSRRSGRPVGLLLLHQADDASGDGPEVRLGYMVAESKWGRGLASKLVGVGS